MYYGGKENVLMLLFVTPQNFYIDHVWYRYGVHANKVSFVYSKF